MQFSSYCVSCLIDRQTKLANQQPDVKKRLEYLKEVMKIMLNAPEGVAAPYINSKADEVFARMFTPGDRYEEIKRRSNELVETKVPTIERLIAASDDRLLTALKFARIGNYIDFGALADTYSDEEFDKLLLKTPDDVVDEAEYKNLINDLSVGKKLMYICDNAGEVVFDRVFIKEIQRRFPHLDVVAASRGKPVLNDVTRIDMHEAGIDKIARIVDNGTSISGTQINTLSEEMKNELYSSDVVIAKGQANFETMGGCGLNVYYVFLCKCQWFTKMFEVPKFTGMFLNEKRVKYKEV